MSKIKVVRKIIHISLTNLQKKLVILATQNMPCQYYEKNLIFIREKRRNNEENEPNII